MALGLCMVEAGSARPAAAAGPLPQEFLGFRLGGAIQAVKGAAGIVTITSRAMMVANKEEYFGALPSGPEIIIYRDCPGRVANKCAWEPKLEDIPTDRPDEPGSLTLFVTRFGEPRLLGLGFKLNPRRWMRTPLEKADASFRSTYGNPVKVSPPKQQTLTVTGTGMKFVSAFASWQWQDSLVRLLVAGDGGNLPGSFGNPEPVYGYRLYAERIDLRRAADELIEKRRAKNKES
jgi:hypothetical protein